MSAAARQTARAEPPAIDPSPDGARPNGELVLPPADRATRPPTPKVESEVVGFLLTGPKRWHRLEILDMEAVRDAKGTRYLPLRRLLKWLDVKAVEVDAKVTFQPEGQRQAVLDLKTHVVTVNAVARTCPLVIRVSDITRQRDIYVDVGVLAAVMGFEMIWDENEYAFRAKTPRELRVWRRKKGKNLLAIRATEVPPDLPERHGPARPRENAVDFFRIKGSARYRGRWTPNADDAHSGALSSLEQALWGGWHRGDYKFRFTEPSFRIDRQGHRFNDGTPVAMAWGQWRYRAERIEVALGDSSFGLNEINLPSVRMAGIRVNGFAGRPHRRDAADTNYALRGHFAEPYLFEGHARVGSEVELIIDDRVIETQQVLADSPTRPGYGTYRFEDIRLSPGIFHKVRIVILDPDGIETVLERDVMGSAKLLHEGESAFLMALGTQRETRTWDMHGATAMGRWLHGLSETVTVGATLAVQDGFYRSRRAEDNGPAPRELPTSGTNAGMQIAWQAHKSLTLTGDLALSQGRGPGLHEGMAVKATATCSPSRDLRFHSQAFTYGPDFFDGTNIELRNRTGYLVLGTWRVRRRWTLRAVTGQVRNNAFGGPAPSRRMSFHGARLATTALPRTTLSVEADRYGPDWDQGPSALYVLKVRTMPLPDVQLEAEVSDGENLGLGEYDDLLDGLRLPGLRTGRTKQTALKLTKRVSRRAQVGAAYRQTTTKRKPSVFHTYRTPGTRKFQMWTEAGQERYLATDRQYAFFENRLEYLLDESGRNRLGVKTLYQRDEWTLTVFLNVESLFAGERRGMRRITSRRINPDRGAIAGVVFLDRNANALMDDGEPGVADVKVRLGRYYTAITDREGRFALPALGSLKQVRVSVDLDTVPAIYSVLHGTQLVNVRPGRLTHVNLAVTPMISLSGTVLVRRDAGEPRPVAGVRVFLVTDDGKETGIDSVTASDGSYYLGEVMPGRYLLRTDPDTIPEHIDPVEPQRPVRVKPTTEEFEEITLPPLLWRPKTQEPAQAPDNK